ncbi:hypothetical protein GmHk_16G047276 [Glycine max]|nr:hypothetical protein GmHk_16G047276 [Glycine max]
MEMYCVLCVTNVKKLSANHLFVSCKFAHDTWKRWYSLLGKSSTLPHAAIDHVYQNSHGIWYILAWTFGGLWGGVRLFGTFGTKETNSFLKTKHHD